MKTHFIPIGAIFAFLAVALGAFGAHSLKGHIDPYLLEVYQTGVQYHMAHALGLILLGTIVELRGINRAYRWSGIAMAAGIVLFSGSLYLMAITGIRWLGMVTPIGGVLFLAAWVLMAAAAWERHRD
jgi:uncharacterized membrane protein YgdD (TMEM256/DUF423 family)